MKSLRRRHALAGLGMTLAGCTTGYNPIVVTQSSASNLSQQKLRRVLIAISVHRAKLTKDQNLSLLQVEELKRSFEAKWPPIGIAVEVINLDGAPDSGRPLIASVNAHFQAGHWLYLQPVSYRFRDHFVIEYEIDATLFDAVTRKRIWRAASQLPDSWKIGEKDYASGSRRQVAADRYVDSLTAKLREDGLV